jgi:hypothetical protein
LTAAIDNAGFGADRTIGDLTGEKGQLWTGTMPWDIVRIGDGDTIMQSDNV